MRILIIEDDPMVAMIHKEYFKKKDLANDLNHVSTLGEAKTFLEKFDADLVVLDNYLTDGQGVEYLPELKGYPIIMITAANDIQTVEAALTNGVVDYLVKPFTYERFSQAVDKVQEYVSLLSKEKINQDLIDGQGIEYLPELKGYPIIMITAANDVQTVEAALSNGVVDYLVKPFTYERFSQAIDKVQDYVKLLSKEKINQDLIDDYLNSGRVEEEEDSLPKGLSKITLKKVLEAIQQHNGGFTTQQIADKLDISRITIRKYLNHLVNINILSEDAEYYTSGRPVSVFTVESESKLEKLL